MRAQLVVQAALLQLLQLVPVNPARPAPAVRPVNALSKPLLLSLHVVGLVLLALLSVDVPAEVAAHAKILLPTALPRALMIPCINITP